MSIFASFTQATIPIPFDPPHIVTIQKLSGRQLAKANQAYFNDLIAGVRERGGAEAQKDIDALFAKTPEQMAAAVNTVQSDPLNGYDKHTLIRYGVKAIDGEPFVTAIDGQPLQPDPVDDMTEEAVEFLSREVMRLTKPALFQTADEQETDRKNG